MALELNGTTGVSAVQAGAVQSGDLPAGSVIQVVSEKLANNFSTTSTSAVDVTGFNASITPISATSKIFIIVSARVSNSSGSNINNRGIVYLAKNSSFLSSYLIGAFLGGVSGNNLNNYHSVSLTHLDSPGLTSEITYKIQIDSETSSNTMTVNSADGASVITLMEIAG